MTASQTRDSKSRTPHGCHVLRPFTPTPEMGIERAQKKQTLRISGGKRYGQNNKHKIEDTNFKNKFY